MCGGRCLPDWGLVPMFTGLVMAVGILTTYAIAVGLGHVAALLPSISDTGIMSPEMHIFSQVLNVVAALAIVTVVLRYKLIHSLVEEEELRTNLRAVKILSRVNLVLGIISAIGLSVVGNFQDNTSVIVHLFGAFLVFLLGNFYSLLDAVVTKKMHPKYNGQRMFWIRLCIGILGLMSFLITTIGATIANKNSIFSEKFERLHWGPDDPGYAAHLVSTFGEWTMGFCFICYFFTYIRDFGKFSTDLKLNMTVRHLDEEPGENVGDKDRGGGYEEVGAGGNGTNNGTPSSEQKNGEAPATERTSLLHADA